MMTYSRLLLSTAFVTGMAAGAQAATISYGSSLGLTNTDFSAAVLGGVQKFDTSLGTLNSVTIDLTGLVAGQVLFENLGATATTVTLNLNAMVSLSTSGLADIVVTLPTLTETRAVKGFDGTIDFEGTSGFTDSLVETTDSETVTLTGGDMADFIGSGLVTLTASGVGLSNTTGSGNLISGFITQAGAELTVTYDYEPSITVVPVPAGLPLVLSGLGALAFLQRRRKD